MIILLKTLLHTLLLPPAGPLVVAGAGALLLGVSQRLLLRRVGWCLLVGALAALWLLATPAVSELLGQLAQRYPALDLTHPPQAQAIVIVGGEGVRPVAPEYGGAPAVAGVLLERIAYGAYLAQRTGLPVLVSGHEVEALAMRATLERTFHVEPRWVESHARDTFENAEFSARLLRPAGVQHILLVTSADHEWRAAHEFESAGLAVVPAPSGVLPRLLPRSQRTPLLSFVPSAYALTRSSAALYELTGDLARRAMVVLHVRRHASASATAG
jgi:uncharacterized SAM-binding protein YcdF (DUF218 family)